MCSSNTFYVSDLFEIEIMENKLDFWCNFEILYFPTHGHPWDHLVSDLHEKL